MTASIENAITVDVEDYFQVAAFKDAIDPQSWERQPSRVVANTERVLEVFAEAGGAGHLLHPGLGGRALPVTGARHPGGRARGRVSRLQSPTDLRSGPCRVPRRDAACQGGAGGMRSDSPSRGYRAASYSITRRSLWALDTLVEAGFEYDSSIFPVHHDNYGIPDSPRHPYFPADAERRPAA